VLPDGENRTILRLLVLTHVPVRVRQMDRQTRRLYPSRAN